MAGVLFDAVATAAYIGVHPGPGPRDGLMTGLVRRTGGSVRLVRTSIEAAVVLTGRLLGSTLGLARWPTPWRSGRSSSPPAGA